MQDNLLFISEKQCSNAYSQWLGSYHWDAFLTVRFPSDDSCKSFPNSLSCESADELIPMNQASLQIRKNVFYNLERFTHNAVGALGAIMPRTASEPRHAHYCIKIFKDRMDTEEAEKIIRLINWQFSEVRNLICTSPSSVVLVPYRHDKHPYYLAKDKNMMRADAIPDSYRPRLFQPLLREAA